MQPLVETRDLKKYFRTNRGDLHAVDGVSFSLEAGKTLGVVGESGCGKSTLGRTVLGLEKATGGQVFFRGEDITNLTGKERKRLLKEMQIIFQDPYASLNPRLCVTELISEPLKVYKTYSSKEEQQKRVLELMDIVGLARRLAFSYPHELDGGRRQRIGVARALALNPSFIVCDEPVSALDVSIQAQILNLLQDLQEEYALAYLFITHDLAVVKHISDDILVMYLGQAVETCSSDELFNRQLHPYTKGLLSAIPIPDVDYKTERILLKGEITTPVNPPEACLFAARCPYVQEDCRCSKPVMKELLPGHFVSCLHAEEINGLKVENEQ